MQIKKLIIYEENNTHAYKIQQLDNYSAGGSTNNSHTT